VNLPARCVVIRDTKLHDPLEGEVDMSPLDVIQMIGRAGRPGYDDEGYGWVVCDAADADRYRRLLREGKAIESRLADDLAEHLNAEVAMGTIHGLDDVMDWLETTFLYHRAQSAPEAYDYGSIRDRVRAILDDLLDRGFIEADDDLGLSPTTLGVLASTYYLHLDTAERFYDLASADPAERDVLRAVARASEFDSVSARQAERDAIDDVLDAGEKTLDPGARKVYAILRGSMDGSIPAALRSDAWVIRQNALRLVAALGEFFVRYDQPAGANLAARLEARIETGVPPEAVGLTALDGVGSGRGHRLAQEDITDPGAVREAGVDGLVDAGLSEGVAKNVLEQARDLPAIEVDWGDFPSAVDRGDNAMREVTVRNVGASARVAVRVTVNGVEMTRDETYLSDATTVPVGVFGADDDRLTYTVTATFPTLPLRPVREERVVAVNAARANL
jgi:hypothetical protein